MLPPPGSDMDPCSPRPAEIRTHAPAARRSYGPMLAPPGGDTDPCSPRPAELWTHAHPVRRSYGPMLAPPGGDTDPCSPRPAELWTHARPARRSYGPMLAPPGGDTDPCSPRPAELWTHARPARRSYGPMLPPPGGDTDPCSPRPAELWTHARPVRRRYGPMLGSSGGDTDPCSAARQRYGPMLGRPAEIRTHAGSVAPADRGEFGPTHRRIDRSVSRHLKLVRRRHLKLVHPGLRCAGITGARRGPQSRGTLAEVRFAEAAVEQPVEDGFDARRRLVGVRRRPAFGLGEIGRAEKPGRECPALIRERIPGLAGLTPHTEFLTVPYRVIIGSPHRLIE